MKMRWLGIALLGLCVGACASPVTPPTPESQSEPRSAPEPEEQIPVASVEDVKVLSEGNNAFAIDLYKKLAAGTDGNIVLSPYSIRTALAMTYAGARGQTADEMRKVLHFALPDERLHPTFGATAHQIKGGKAKSYQLNVANSLWGQKGFPLRQEFLELTKKNYASGLHEVDFAANPSGSREIINRWVEEKTQHKIKDLLTPDDITPATRVVLTNAIYMQAAWDHPFPKDYTKIDYFEPSPNRRVEVPMMRHDLTWFRVSSTTDLYMLEIPYRGDLAMLVVLPTNRWGLREVEKKLSGSELQKLITDLEWKNHREVVLPRFTVRSDFDLATTLKGMGMPMAFGAADFSAMSPGGGLSIDKVVHRGLIEVDEVGTTAVAATATSGAVSYSDFPFRADQPFMFLIIARSTGTVLFLGRCLDPTLPDSSRIK